MDKFLARKESFGYAIFDKESLKYDFMGDDEYRSFAAKADIEEWQSLPFNDGKILSAPIKIYYDLTSACNLRCKSCHNESAFSKDDELTTEKALKVVEGARQDNIFHIKFSGGEITQRQDWELILAYAKNIGLVVSINTNGIYSKKTLDMMISLPLDEINISLDGNTQINDYIRGSGSYNAITSTIKSLHESGKKVTINSLITKMTTQDDIQQVLDFGSKYSYSVDFFHIRPIGRAAKNDYLNIGFDELAELYTLISQCKAKYPNLAHDTKLNGNIPHLIKGGTDGFYTFNILPNGDLFAGGCVRYVSQSKTSLMKLGNILKENFSVRNIWQNSRTLWRLRDSYAKLQMRCDVCENHPNRCYGFTPEMVLFKELNGKNPFCKYIVGSYGKTNTMLD